MKCQNERGQSKDDPEDERIGKGSTLFLFGSGTSSRKEVDDVASETSWTAVRKSKERERWEPQGEAEKPQAKEVYHGRAEGGPADPKKLRGENVESRKELGWKWTVDCLKEKMLKTQSPKRNVVLESLILSPEEVEENTLCHVQV